MATTRTPQTSPVSVSTRQASRLLGSHESSVKRWCNAGDLECWLTPGGHRRIPVSSLVAYARANAIDAPLAVFGANASDVWVAVDQAVRAALFDELALLCYERLEHGSPGSVVEIIQYALTGEDHDPLSLHALLHAVVGHAMDRVGAAYHSGSITIGDEHRMTQAMRDVLVTLFTIRQKEENAQRAHAIVGCARSEEHELGALVVRLLLQEAGWKVTYLGLNVPTEEFATQQLSLGAELVCVSLMQPRGLSEARSIVTLLDRMYDMGHPYSLALGGSALRGVTIDDRRDARIPQVKVFETVDPFVRWLAAGSGELLTNRS